MTLHKNESRLFKKHPTRFKKLLLVFIGFILFAKCLVFFLHHTPTQLFNIKEYAIEDVDFSDIYYQTRSVNSAKNKQVVLVNIGYYPTDSLRYRLDTLIERINSFKPKVIGVDVYFEPKPDKPAFEVVNKKLDSLFQSRNIVIGTDYATLSEFPIPDKANPAKTVNYGYINIPDKEGETLREYYYQHPVIYLPNTKTALSLAFKMYQLFEGFKTYTHEDSTFMIRYSSGTEKGFYNALTTNDPTILQDTVQDFPAIEANDLISISSKQHNDKIDSLIKDKCVIIGVLGNPVMAYPNDLTDKHRVPLDFQLFNRMPVMPGTVVHANALQMLINNEGIHTIDGWLFNAITGIIIFLYLLMFMLFEKIKPFLLKLIVEILFLILSVLLIIRLSSGLMAAGYHMNVATIFLYLAFLVEYKIFAFDLYEYLEKKSLYERLSGWYSYIKSFFSKRVVARKIKATYIKIDIEIETEITKKDNDEV